MLRNIVNALTLLLVLAIFYFSWVPSPDLRTTGLLPHWLALWTERNHNLRTAVPFFALGFCAVYWKKRPSTEMLLFLCFVLVLLAECGQLYLPGRHFDIRDIGWGVVGGILGFDAGGFFLRFYNRFFHTSKRKRPKPRIRKRIEAYQKVSKT
jgi:glycopeptide antibiotics resistance protein